MHNSDEGRWVIVCVGAGPAQHGREISKISVSDQSDSDADDEGSELSSRSAYRIIWTHTKERTQLKLGCSLPHSGCCAFQKYVNVFLENHLMVEVGGKEKTTRLRQTLWYKLIRDSHTAISNLKNTAGHEQDTILVVAENKKETIIGGR